MDRKVKVRRPPGSPFTLVYSDPPPRVDLDKLQPNFYMSRIWLGTVPEEVGREAGQDKVYPAHACVLGEVWDDNPQQRDRPRILLDEAVALNPEHFSDAECERYRITEKEFKFPTIMSLRQAVVALKDIWWPSKVVVPPDKSFFDSMLRTDALYYYEPHIADAQYERWHPFFKSKGRVADQGIFQVETENRLYNERLIDAMFSQDLLQVVAENTTFPTGATPPAFRCLGMLINEMQRQDETPFIRQRTTSDALLDEEARELLEDERNSFLQYEMNIRHLFEGEI